MLQAPTRLVRTLSALTFAAWTLAACGTAPAPAPEMSMEEQMALATELGTPGEGHARLEPMVGTFSSVMTMWMEPGADPMVSEGTSINGWILGGRYLRSDYKADFMGMPFEGYATTAYDNRTGAYYGTWIDNMSTNMLPVSEGQWDDATRSLTSYRSYTDPLTELPVTTRDVIRIVSNDEHIMEMHETKGDAPERKLFEIVYTRQN